MNFVVGTILDIRTEGAERTGRIRVSGAITTVNLNLLPDAKPGDQVLASGGVGITVMLDTPPGGGLLD